MGDGIHVTSFDALRALDAALGVFSAKCLSAIEEVEAEVRRKVAELEERRRQCERKVASLSRACEEAGRDDDAGQLARRLAEAEAELRTVRSWLRRVEESRRVYERCAKRVSHLSSSGTTEARSFLKQKVEELSDYVGAHSAPASGGVSAAGLAGGAGAGQSAGSFKDALPLSVFPLPEGYIWIPLARIDARDLEELPRPESFKGVGYENACRGLNVLRSSVLPAMMHDPLGVDGDYFYEQDRAAGREEVVNSLRGVYDAYFGLDHIWVDKSGDGASYRIGNGQGRIRAALDMGWDAVPAKVIGKV
jgi:hypothetical protein